MLPNRGMQKGYTSMEGEVLSLAYFQLSTATLQKILLNSPLNTLVMTHLVPATQTEQGWCVEFLDSLDNG